MSERPEDICPRGVEPRPMPTAPHAAPIYLSSVYQCFDPRQAATLLRGEEEGYVYRRDGHPNADWLAERCRELHGAERAAITGTGMGALAVVLLARLQAGDRLVVSDRLYGVTTDLVLRETARLGMESVAVDVSDVSATRTALAAGAKLLLVETISNPTLRVPDLAALAQVAHEAGAILVVDNSFASPVVCRPLELGADLVVESLTKIMNGHSDLVLGCVCGHDASFERVEWILSRWGLAASPMDCWLALRGLATLALRAREASQNALRVAEFLAQQAEVASVVYPGLASHVDHEIAERQFGGLYGSIVTFTLRGGLVAAERLIDALRGEIPFCPSLGEVATTLSHPASTSHRSLSAAARAELGIDEGTIRLSLGIESSAWQLAALAGGLRAVGAS